MHFALAFTLDELAQTLPPELNEESSQLLAEAEKILVALASASKIENPVVTERLAAVRARRAKLTGDG
jgi:hypothetical protein